MILAALMLSAALAAPGQNPGGSVHVAPNSASFVYSPYNWLVTGEAAKTINAGAYFRIRLDNTAACAIGLNIGAATPYSECWARLDTGSWQEYIPTASGPQTWMLTLPSPTTSRTHLLEFVVKSTTETKDRWDNLTTAVQFTGLTLDPGAGVTLPAARKYRVLLYGDSITEGVRVNGYEGIPDDTDRNDSVSDYSYQLGQLLNAEVGVVGFGATGLQTGGSGNVPALPLSYNYLWSGQERSFSPVPDLVVYNEGTNDGNAPIGAELAAVIRGIGYAGKTNTFSGLNGTRHLVLEPFGGYESLNLQAEVKAIDNANVTYGSTAGFWNSKDSSDGLHPYAYAHLSIAPQVAVLISPLLTPQESR